jgi:hypothetical protein
VKAEKIFDFFQRAVLRGIEKGGGRESRRGYPLKT